MKIKPNRYYKECYKDNVVEYFIIYVDEKYVYLIACKYKDDPLYKYNTKHKWGTIEAWLNRSNKYRYSIENITKEDIFLELL